jgi:hypothetical protein
VPRRRLVEAGHDAGEVGLDDLEDRRPHEEVLELGLEVGHDLLGEEVVELVLRPRQAPDESADLARRCSCRQLASSQSVSPGACCCSCAPEGISGVERRIAVRRAATSGERET